MSLRWLLHTIIIALFPFSQLAEKIRFVPIVNLFHLFFFPPISQNDSGLERPRFFLPFAIISHLDPPVFIFLTLYLYVWIRRTLQTVGPSHARTYTVAVYFKGERIGCGKGPRWVRQYYVIKHNRTRRSPSQCTANGLENNGCALLMVFIIAIKLLLAHSIGRNIMQNENDSIHYWSDINCLMEISLSAEVTVLMRHCIYGCIPVYLEYCVWEFLCLTAHLCACSYIHTSVKQRKWISVQRPFQGWRGWR